MQLSGFGWFMLVVGVVGLLGLIATVGGGIMTHRYTFVRARGYVSGGKCGICHREYSGKVCPYCTQTVLGFLAVALLFAPVLLGAN